MFQEKILESLDAVFQGGDLRKEKSHNQKPGESCAVVLYYWDHK